MDVAPEGAAPAQVHSSVWFWCLLPVFLVFLHRLQVVCAPVCQPRLTAQLKLMHVMQQLLQLHSQHSLHHLHARIIYGEHSTEDSFRCLGSGSDAAPCPWSRNRCATPDPGGEDPETRVPGEPDPGLGQRSLTRHRRSRMWRRRRCRQAPRREESLRSGSAAPRPLLQGSANMRRI